MQCTRCTLFKQLIFLNRSKAVLTLLDPSPGRKPSVMKCLWKGYFVVSNFSLLFQIPFQEKLNWFCSPGLLCCSPFFSPLLFGVKTWCRCRIPLPGLTSLHKVVWNRSSWDYSSLYNGMVYSKEHVLFSSMQFFSQSEGSLEWKFSLSCVLLMVCRIM